QKALVSYLDIRLKTGAGDGWIDEATALRASGASHDTLNRLIAAELVVRRAVNRAVLESAADFAPTLTPEQAIAWREMETLLESEHPSPLLLRGVTGSGKTELYLRAIAWALRKGESAIILAPEIALATHLVRRVSARFPADTVTIHSQQSTRDRLDAWYSTLSGEKRIVIGPRSALFAPLERIGLIVLDEEHEPAYKQDSAPRYH
ncbi:MAG: DEAD/DEAH box helicase, partial [Planctomycetales bacterium]|nr:DEAD/DEAH box helicase [Planctomycetales bacterium]